MERQGCHPPSDEGQPFLQVGDSLTRYQYLSLAHFLARGVWPERCSKTLWIWLSLKPAERLVLACATLTSRCCALVCRYGASSEFGKSVCIETEFGNDWCAQPHWCVALDAQASPKLQKLSRVERNEIPAPLADHASVPRRRRHAFYNYTSTLLSDARGARSFESCNCKREVRPLTCVF
jgi:hypothetical protein